MRIDAVFFDAGSTIIYPEPSVGAVYADALAREGLRAEPQQAEEAFAAACRRLRDALPPGRLEYGRTEAEAMDWWRGVTAESAAPFGRPGAPERLFRRLWNHFIHPQAWRIYGDVLPVFAALRAAGRGVGLISNWDTRLPALLDELDLSRRFDWVHVSCLVGAEKPDPAIFRRALVQSGLPAERALHVGDSYRDDVAGALAAGMHAAWLRRDGAHEALDGDEGAPDGDVLTVRSLDELVGCVLGR